MFELPPALITRKRNPVLATPRFADKQFFFFRVAALEAAAEPPNLDQHVKRVQWRHEA